MAKKKALLIKRHDLIPQHIKLTEKEKRVLFEKYGISLNELPRINLTDPAIARLKAKAGDVIKIVRKSQTSEESAFYRGVVSD